VGKFISETDGALVTMTFPVFWGAAIVLFLTKIIDLHDKNLQGFWVEVSSQVENGQTISCQTPHIVANFIQPFLQSQGLG